MAPRKGILSQLVAAQARSRAERERERLRQQRQAEAALARAQREDERQYQAALKQYHAQQGKAAREAERAAVAKEKELKAAENAANREAQQAAAAREKTKIQAEKAARQAALEAKLAQVAHQNAALHADAEAFEQLLATRSRPQLSVAKEAEGRFNREGPDGLVDTTVSSLAGSVYPPGLDGSVAAEYRPETRELIVELELPRQDVVPTAAEFRYIKARDVIEPVKRKEVEVKAAYARLIARIVLRTISETLESTPATVVTAVALNGYVSSKDRATGQPIRPCLISVGVSREEFAAVQLDEPELDPQACLRQYLNAIVSPHPYDLEPVRPLVTFDLSKYKFVDEMSIVAGLDSRPDLLDLKPVEFEHLVRELFEAMGMKSWVTQASRDDGVDAVVVNKDPILGGLCVIQAKRYSRIVGLEAVNALSGVMNDKAAAKGILVTTSWVGQASRDFAARNGRMTIIEGRELRHLIKEHLGRDVLISLDKLPPEWTASDLGSAT